MAASIYSRFVKDPLILRDELAIDRTLLSNERTLLAYLRSGVALAIAGVTMTHFSQESWFWVVGLMCIPAGVVVSVIGIARYRKMDRSIRLLREQSAMDSKNGGEPIQSSERNAER
ncbi:MAG: DUF202 domain-containing protein [Phycisphaerae bacterium]|nr:DUF202 domain-containing protein [Phycisphaerae bacterium]